MKDEAEVFKRLLFQAIGPLGKSDFQNREAVYNDARQKLNNVLGQSGGESRDKERNLERVIRSTEQEIVQLSKLHVDKLASRAKLISSLAASIIGTLYVVVQLKDFSFLRALEIINPDYLFQAALTAYFCVIGAGFATDIETQKQIYVVDPNHGKIDQKSILAIATYLVTAALLAIASHDRIVFAVAITLWHFSGIAFWKILARQLAPIISESERSAALREDYYAIEKLALVRRYLLGDWHNVRHAILTILIVLFDFVAIPSAAERYVTNNLIPHSLGSTVTEIAPHLSTAVFIIFASVGEGWTWIQRIATRLSLNTIEDFERRYNLEKRAIGDFSDEGDLLPIILPKI